jgi:hypothetical protein
MKSRVKGRTCASRRWKMEWEHFITKIMLKIWYAWDLSQRKSREGDWQLKILQAGRDGRKEGPMEESRLPQTRGAKQGKFVLLCPTHQAPIWTKLWGEGMVIAKPPAQAH